jgi:hypothetical protein
MQEAGVLVWTIWRVAASATRLASTWTGGQLVSLSAPIGHYAAPHFRLCEDAGFHVEVSWALAGHPDKTERRALEARLIHLHREATGFDPPIQHGGRGVDAYLEKRRANRA